MASTKGKELGTKRVSKALNDIRLIGNLSATNYALSESDVDTIEAALNESVRATIDRLRHAKAAKPTFSL